MGYRRREFLQNVAGAGLLGILPGRQALLAEEQPPVRRKGHGRRVVQARNDWRSHGEG